MSRTVDERVVSMQFDNSNFESNVKTTMSTLEKLKQSLNLSGASKGLESLTTAANKCDIAPLGNAVDTVKMKFSALEVMGVTALANITNSAVNAGKRIASALTIDPIKTGFQEYETQINAVQTILANTESKGTTIDDVNKALDTLNTYADKTIYNFTEMTRNIGTFTAAGVDLNTSVDAIQGIANLAAVSGSTSQQASTAMYQLSQALASGTVKLMDWNSVVNAGMGGEVFQNALKETARVHGVAIDEMIEDEGSFRETLKDGWLTSEILTETLMKFTMATEGLTEAEIKANKEKLRGLGYTDEQIEGIFKLGNTATNAATKVKTFTQLWDVMKESAQSGWSKTWKLIIGDFEAAKELLTPLSDFLTGAINKFSDFRNDILESALGKSFAGLVDVFDNVETALSPVTKVADSVSKVTDALKDYDTIANEIIRGDWGNGQYRWDQLTEAGYDWAHAQNLVNERLGSGVRHTTDYTEAVGKAADSTEKQEKATTKLTDANKEQLKKLAAMTEEQMRSKGYTDEQIQAFKDLGAQAEKLGLPMDEFIDNLDEINGRWLLINSFKNIGESLVAVFTAVGKAWREVFWGDASDEEILAKRSERIFNLIAGLHKLTSYIEGLKHRSDELTRTFKGVFAALDIVTTLLGGPLKIAFTVLKQILSVFDMDILDFTATIGDSIVGIRDWLDSVLDFSKIIEKIMPGVTKVVDAVRDWIDANVDLAGGFEKVRKIISNAVGAITDWIDGLKESENLPKDIAAGIIKGLGAALKYVTTFFKTIFQTILNIVRGTPDGMSESGKSIGSDFITGLVNGLWEGIKLVGQVILEIGKNLLTKLCDILGVESPSWKAFDIAKDFIQGFINGLKAAMGNLGKILGTVGEFIIEKFKGVVGFLKENFGAIAAIVGGVFIIKTVSKLADALGALAKITMTFPQAMQDMFDSFGEARVIKAKAKMLLSLAISIGILAYALIQLSELSWPEIGKGIAVLAGLAAILAIVTIVLTKFQKDVDPVKLGSFATIMISFSAAIAILAYSLKIMDSIDGEHVWRNVAVLGVMAVGLGGIAALMSKIAPQLSKGSLSMIGIAAAILLLVLALSKLDALTIENPEKVVGSLVVLVAGLALVARVSQGVKLGSTIGLLTMVLSLTLFVRALEKLANADTNGIRSSVGTIIGIMALLGILMLTTKFAGANAIKAGVSIIAISTALLLVIFAIKMIAGIDAETLARGISAISQLLVIFGLILVLSKFAGENAAKAGVMLMSMAVALVVIAAAMGLLSIIPEEGLNKALRAVSQLIILLGLVVAATHFAKDAKGSLIALAVIIGILVVAIAALSFISAEDLTKSVAALSAVMIVFALLVASTKFIQTGEGTFLKTASTLIVLTGIVYLLTYVMAELAKIGDADSAIKSATALSMLLLTISGVCVILGNARSISNDAIFAAVAMGAVLFEIALVLRYLDGTDPNGLLIKATALSELLLTLTAACLILSYAKSIGNDAMLAAVAMGAVLLEIAVVLEYLDGINTDGLLAKATALSELLLAVSAACLILGYAGRIDSSAVTGAVMMGVVLFEIAVVLQYLEGLNTDSLLTKATALSELLLAVSAACFVLGYAGKVSDDAILAAVMMGVVLFEIATVLRYLEGMETDALFTKATALSQLLLAISAACFALGYTGKVSNDAIFAAVAMGAVLFEIAAVLKYIEDMKTDGLLAKATALSVLLLAVSAACVILSMSGTVSASAIVAAALLGVVLLEIAFVLKCMNDWGVVPGVEQVTALSILLIALSAVTLILSMVGGLAGAAIAGAVGLMGVIAVIGGVAMAIGLVMDLIPESLIERWKAGFESFMDFIVILAGGLGEAISAFASGLMTSFPEIGLSLSAFMVGVQGFIDGVSSIDASVGDGVKALVTAILAITGATVVESIASWLGLGSTNEFGAKLVAFGESMMQFADSISELTADDIEKIKMAADAGTAMADMASAIPNEGGWAAKIMGENDMKSFGQKLAAFGESLVSYATIVRGLTEDDITKITTSAEAGKALTDMAGSIPNEGGWAADIMGENDLVTFGAKLVAFGGCLVGYSQVITSLTDEHVSAITKSADAGMALTDLADSIPNEGGWAAAILGENDMAEFGSSLIVFGRGLMSYAGSVLGLTDEHVTAITRSKDAVDALVEVADAIPTEGGIGGLLFGDQNIGDFGSGMVSLAKGLTNYTEAASAITEDDIDAIKNSKEAIEAMADAAKKVPSYEEELPAFGPNMTALADSVVSYASKVSGLTDDDVDNIKRSKDAIKKMADAAGSVPNSGGVGGWLFGDNDNIPLFGSNMEAFAGSLMSYASKVAEITDDDITAIEYSKTAMKAMADAAGSVPNEGGVGGWLFGDNENLASFGTNMEAFAGSLMSYAAKVSNISEDDVTAIEYSKTAMKAMSDAAEAVPNSGGVGGWLFGDNNDIGSFGANMASFASGLRRYIIRVRGITDEDIDSINLSKKATVALIQVSNYIPQITASFSGESFSATIDNLSSFVKVAKSMVGVDFGGVSGFVSALGELGTASVDEFIAAFSGASDDAFKVGADLLNNLLDGISSRTDDIVRRVDRLAQEILNTIRKKGDAFRLCASNLMLKFGVGITDKKSFILIKVSSLLNAIVVAIRNRYYNFSQAGAYLVEGFAAGISSNAYKAKAKSTAMAKAALRAAEEALDENSPSKEFYKVGAFAGLGFVNALGDYASKAYSAGSVMATKARTGLSNAISKITDVINSDIDTQPTIRPVLDLSDVSNGASLINGMFGMTPSVGLLSNVGSISGMMNRSQNGANDDVVSAITDLKKAIGKSSGDTYQINGITYDDGSNVSEAIQTLIRHARMDRRV